MTTTQGGATPGPTELQIALANWATELEGRKEMPPATYYRLYPQIIDARYAIALARTGGET